MEESNINDESETGNSAVAPSADQSASKGINQWKNLIISIWEYIYLPPLAYSSYPFVTQD